MRRLRYLGSALLSASAMTVDAHADNFAKLRGSPNYQGAVYAGAQKSEAWLNDSCAGANATMGPSVGVMEMPNVDDKGVPQSGRWAEHVAVDGCGTHRQFNVLVSVARPGSLSMIPMLAGTTHADPTLQKDGARYAVVATAAAIDPQGCKPIFFVDTRFVRNVDEPPLIAGKPGWTEVWTIAQCKTRVDVEMRFIPDATGTKISAHRVPSP